MSIIIDLLVALLFALNGVCGVLNFLSGNKLLGLFSLFISLYLLMVYE